MRKINKQLNYAEPESLAVRTASMVRQKMFRDFINFFNPLVTDTVCDIGVTSDQTYASSNYFEMLYPYKSQITACGLDDAKFLEHLYPGVKFTFANALDLPFMDSSFDYVHSSAVWEHVGNTGNQKKMLLECLRVARKGVMLTTPNRWFPIEFHSQLPFLHWMPKKYFRRIVRHTRFNDLANEEVLNLLTTSEIKEIIKSYNSEWRFKIRYAHLLGLRSNILLYAYRK